MHVAIVGPYSMSRPGGVQEHVRGLARGLHRLGHEVTVFAPEFRGRQPDLEGIATVSLGGAVNIPANGSIAPLGIDPRMIVRFDLGLDPADVVHIHEPFLPAGLFAMYRRPNGTPIVGTFHAAAERFWPYAVTAPFLRRAARRLDTTTAVSPEARRLVRRYVNVDPVVVPNGVDVESFVGAEPDEWAVSLGRVILFVGRSEARKGFGVVARAFAQVAAKHPDAHLVATVAPDDVPSDVFSDRLHCIGAVAAERRNSLHAAAEVVCCPSLAGESFGLVVLEGLAGGSAVVASDIPGYRHAGGDAVIYAPPGDAGAWSAAIAALLDDDDRRQDLAVRGRERARLFDWSRIAADTALVYERALAG